MSFAATCFGLRRNKHKTRSQGSNTLSRKNKEEWKLITNIKNKLRINLLIITKADKGKTLIIVSQEE
jgi:hypothetical protein